MQNPENPNQLKIKSYPWITWIVCIGLIAMDIFVFSTMLDNLLVFIAPAVVLILALFSSIDTITADRMTRMLTIQNRSALRNRVVEIPFSDVDQFEIETSRTHSSRGGSSTVYRVSAVRKSGERVPLQTAYTSGYNGKAKTAERLRVFLNLPEPQQFSGSMLQAGILAQAALTADPALASSGTTAGVPWKIDVFSVGTNRVTHWFSEASVWPGQFLLVSQKPQGSPSMMGGGLLGGMMKMFYAQVLGLYGFKPEDTPGVESAVEIKYIDPRLAQVYATLTSDEVYAPAMLNQYAVQPLLGWAERHPMKTVTAGNAIGQLAALYSPRGVHVAVLGQLPPAGQDELISIGVELVKAQSGPKIG